MIKQELQNQQASLTPQLMCHPRQTACCHLSQLKWLPTLGRSVKRRLGRAFQSLHLEIDQQQFTVNSYQQRKLQPESQNRNKTWKDEATEVDSLCLPPIPSKDNPREKRKHLIAKKELAWLQYCVRLHYQEVIMVGSPHQWSQTSTTRSVMMHKSHPPCTRNFGMLFWSWLD